MCLGIPGRVVEMVDGYGDQLALVDVGRRRPVNIGMLEGGPRPRRVGADPHGLRGRARRRGGRRAGTPGLRMMGRGIDDA